MTINGQMTLGEINAEYQSFVDKFKPKKTTDDCYTPPNIMPSAQPTLYGYQIEHLALIATVMQKKEITAEKAVEIFSDIRCIATMLVEEIQNKVDEEMERWAT